jgi:hypothetical protein
VAKSRTNSTTAPVVSWASWLRPPAPSTICVWVGLPLTTNAPENAAATLAAPSPARSVSALKVSSYFAAYARAVAALWARITTNIDTAGPSSRVPSCQPMAGGATGGSPRGTDPRTATPWPARPAERLTMIEATIAISAPGIRRVILSAISTTARTAAETATVARSARGNADIVCTSRLMVRVLVTVSPSMSGSCAMATWIPTPARNPSRMVRDRKLARNPSLASRASSSRTPVSSAASPARCTYLADAGAAMPARAAASMAAVAESEATTR